MNLGLISVLLFYIFGLLCLMADHGIMADHKNEFKIGFLISIILCTVVPVIMATSSHFSQKQK